MANLNQNKKYHFLYKTTNLLNGRFYYGMHSTNKLDDNYLGSGRVIKSAIRKYGKENFKREILEFFDTREELVKAEKSLITEDVVKNSNSYNLQEGGEGFNSSNTIPVIDKYGNCFRVHKDDPRYLSGELVHNTVGKVVVKDRLGNTLQVNIDDLRYLSDELVHVNKGLVNVKDVDGNRYKVKVNDPRYLRGDLKSVTKDEVTVKDNNGKVFNVSVNDPRYLSGELVHIWTGKKHSEETKKKIGETNSKRQRGKRNSQYGTCWVTNNLENKKIKKDDLEQFLSENKDWRKGRKMKL